jgi:hypothetical protein
MCHADNSLRVNDTSSSRCLGSLSNGPRSNLVRSTSKEPDQVQRRVSGSRNLAQSAGRADLFLLLLGLLLTHILESLLESDREGDQEITWVVLIDPSLDLGQPLVLLSDVVSLGQVDEVDDGLGGKELKTVDDLDLWAG